MSKEDNKVYPLTNNIPEADENIPGPSVYEKPWDPKDKEVNRENFKAYDYWKEYSEYSTVMGMIFIFFEYQSVFGKVFWIIIVVLMTILGLYWTVQAYLDWQTKPVVTTITTVSYPTKNVDFPAVTICSPGYNSDTLQAGFLKQVFDFYEKNQVHVNMTPYEAAVALNQNTTNPNYQTVKNLLSGTKYSQFLNATFPGLDPQDDIISLFTLLASQNPDADIASMVAFDGGYDPCSNQSQGLVRKKRSTPTCDNGLIPDPSTFNCYISLPDIYGSLDGSDACNDLYDGASEIYFTDDNSISGFISLLKSGAIALPSSANGSFYLAADLNPDQGFMMAGLQVNSSFTKMYFDPADDQSGACLVARISPKTPTSLELTTGDCYENRGFFCQSAQTGPPNCTAGSTFQPINTIDLLFDPSKKSTKNQALALKKNYFKDLFKKLNLKSAFPGIFTSLWYGSLPCFDVKGLSSEKDGDKGILRYCEWKGTILPCGAVFTMFPTDQGMCCSFNIRAAEDIFQGETFAKLVSDRQKFDKNSSFVDTTLPKKYTLNNEPTTLPGRNKGLILMLDAHTDLLNSGSVNSDQEGFLGLVSPSGSFPFMMQEAFPIKPGHNNIIALTGIDVNPDDSLERLSVKDRQCLYPKETEGLFIHKNYTYSNCLFECSLFYAAGKVKEKYNLTESCMPWFFPSNETSITTCDPWQAVDFFNFTVNDIPDTQCAHCYTDCKTSLYDVALSSAPFRPCDSASVGVSKFCQTDNAKLPKPTKFADAVLGQYQGSTIPSFLNGMVSSTRTYGSTLKDHDIFSATNGQYSAYDIDIAMVQLYFKKSTVLQMGSQPSLTWVTYLSNVGGLMGLVLGMGFISFIELFWTCLRIIARRCGFWHIIP